MNSNNSPCVATSSIWLSGVIIGAAFSKITSSLVGDIIMPPIGALIGGVNFTDLVITLKQASVAANGR